MTQPAVGEVIKKPYQYLDKFITLMRDGAEVAFTDEQVATRRIYKDGDKVKRILEVYDDLVNTGIDVFDSTVLYDIFRDEAKSQAYRKIEFQSITDPKKIEVLLISKIGKQNVSGRGGRKSNFGGKESDYTESLQCVALAYKQSVGASTIITEDDFKQFLLHGRNEDAQVLRVVKDNVISQVKPSLLFQYGLEKPEWITSCVNVANALYKSPYLKSSVQYDFYHAGAKEIEWFKSKFKRKFNQVLANKLRQQGYGSGDSGEDKWNPADMFAIKKQTTEQKVDREITTRGFFNSGTLKDYDKFKRGKSGILATDDKLTEDMAELTRYNNWIHQNILGGEFIPISLKKTLNTAKVNLISNPSLEEYSIDVDNINVSWEPAAQKIYVYFDVTYTFVVGDQKKKEKNTTSYFFDCRNFGKDTNVQFELGIKGSSAKHGKISTGPAEMIIDLTSPTFNATLKQTRKDFIKIMNTPNVRKRYFPKLNAAPSSQVLETFTQEVTNKTKPFIFMTNEDINKIVAHSGWPGILESYLIFLSRKRNYTIPNDDNLKKSYFKSKLAAVELGWMLTNRKIVPVLKNNILKSLYLYASSQGLQIFGDSGLLKTSYFYNSSYVKVRD
jgi:hypothetical protein